MLVGITVHEVQVADFLDKDASLEIRNIEGKRALPAGRLESLAPDAEQRIAALKEHGVEMLVCGAIGEETMQGLARAGINVAPLQSGDARAVLRSVLEMGQTARPGAPLGGTAQSGLRPCGPCAVRQRGFGLRGKG